MHLAELHRVVRAAVVTSETDGAEHLSRPERRAVRSLGRRLRSVGGDPGKLAPPAGCTIWVSAHQPTAAE
jgi:hypothetical protein